MNNGQRTFTVTLSEGQGVALLQLLEISLKGGGEQVVDAYVELRNLIRKGAQAALAAENIQHVRGPQSVDILPVASD